MKPVTASMEPTTLLPLKRGLLLLPERQISPALLLGQACLQRRALVRGFAKGGLCHGLVGRRRPLFSAPVLLGRERLQRRAPERGFFVRRRQRLFWIKFAGGFSLKKPMAHLVLAFAQVGHQP